MVFHQQCNSRGNYNYNAYTYTNRDWAAHFHKNFELIYVFEGSLNLCVDGVTEIMCEGDWALILSNQIHSFESLGPSRFWVAIFCEQFVTQFAGYIEKYVGESAVFRCRDSVHEFLMDNLVNTDSSITMKKACFYAACDEYLRCASLHERVSRNDTLVCAVLDYISEHCCEDITLSSAAQRFGYEYHYLSRLLNKGYQINFPNLVNEYRVDIAIRLLETTDKTITDIALECGFRSIRNFNHAFRAITGMAPSNYNRNQTSTK